MVLQVGDSVHQKRESSGLLTFAMSRASMLSIASCHWDKSQRVVTEKLATRATEKGPVGLTADLPHPGDKLYPS